MPLVGLGGYPAPTRNLTSDDAKLSGLEGLQASFAGEFFRGFGATSARSKEREILQLPEEREAKLKELRGMDPNFLFQRQFLETPDVGQTFSAEEATERMKPWGFSYDKPQSEAQLDFDLKNAKAKIKRDNRLSRIQNGFLPKSLALIGGFAGALADPPTALTVFIPGAPEIKAVLAAGKASKRLALVKGSQATLKIGDEAFGVAPRLFGGSKRTDMAVGFAEGVAFDLAIEAPNYIIAQGLQEEYSIQSLILSTLASGTLTGMIQLPRGILARATENARIKSEFQKLIEVIEAEPSSPKRLEILNRVDFDFLDGENPVAVQLRKLAERELNLKDLGEAGRKIDEAVSKMNEELTMNYRGASTLDHPQESLDHDLFFMTREDDVVRPPRPPRPPEIRPPRPPAIRAPEFRAARDADIISSDTLASSKRLDEVGEAEGRPEVRQLDRTKHLRKDFELRINTAFAAYEDVLEGRPVNVDHMMKEAILVDMNNRGLISDAEYKTSLEKVLKSRNERIEAGSPGVFSDPNVELIPAAEVKKGELSPQQQKTDSVAEAETQVAALSDDIEEFDFSPEFAVNQKAFDEATDTLSRLETDNGRKAMDILANCMGGAV